MIDEEALLATPLSKNVIVDNEDHVHVNDWQQEIALFNFVNLQPGDFIVADPDLRS